jgi:adenylosuccinate synthase
MDVNDATAIVEGTQGYGLGLHAGRYPYCTSSDCRAIDFFAMAGINPWSKSVSTTEIWLVCRTYPIRVAGNSGELHNETDWETLAALSGGYIKPERTTVTKKIRRVGGWDPMLVAEAVAANGGPDTVRIALTFLDYIDPSGANKNELTDKMEEYVLSVQREQGVSVAYAATGPNSGVWL